MRQGRRLAKLLLPLVLLLAGCWDRREIEERSNVLATGVDVCTKGPDCHVIVTRQIAIPGRIPLGGGSSGAVPKGESVVVFSTPGRDGPDTAGKAQAELNRTTSFAHTRALVFSEAFARQGLRDYLDYVRRVPEVRRLMWVIVSEGKASDVIRSRPSLELVPALFLNDMIDDAAKSGRLPNITLGEFLTRLSNRGEDAIAPLIRMQGLDHPVLAGLAVFREHQMVGKLSPAEMFAYMELRGVRTGAGSLPLPLPNNKIAYLGVYERKTRYTVRLHEGQILCRIRINLETDLTHLSPGLPSNDPAVLESLEAVAETLVMDRGKALLKKLQQEYKADILGIGEMVRAHLPRYWKTIDKWEKEFPKVQFQVEAHVEIRRTGTGAE